MLPCVCCCCCHRAQAGRRTSLPSKNVVLVLPGNAYTAEALERFNATAAAADSSLLEIAWAVASEDPPGSSYSLSQLCQVLFDSESAIDQYATFSMLLSDSIYFKSSYKVRILVAAAFLLLVCWMVVWPTCVGWKPKLGRTMLVQHMRRGTFAV